MAEQTLILYDQKDKDGTVTTQIYSSAYGAEDVSSQVMYCARRYGRHANVRSCLASYHVPK